jgi:hypothetical protein
MYLRIMYLGSSTSMYSETYFKILLYATRNEDVKGNFAFLIHKSSRGLKHKIQKPSLLIFSELQQIS